MDCGLCSAVYASPVPGIRKDLWADVSKLASDISSPWLLTGDFNVYKSQDEK